MFPNSPLLHIFLLFIFYLIHFFTTLSMSELQQNIKGENTVHKLDI